jgi:hypothetical protein
MDSAGLQIIIPDVTGMATSGEVVIPYDVLRLVKYLRSQHLPVTIGDGSGPLRYGVRKGVTEFFQNPVILSAVQVPLSIITGLIANYLFALFKGRAPQGPENLIVEIQNGDQRVRFDYRGRPDQRRTFQAAHAGCDGVSGNASGGEGNQRSR